MPALAAVRCVGSSSCRCAHLVLQSDGEPWALFAKTVDPVRAKVPNQLEGRLLVEIISWELVENLGHFVSRDKNSTESHVLHLSLYSRSFSSSQGAGHQALAIGEDLSETVECTLSVGGSADISERKVA